MKIQFHGGKCCGIKHISGLGNNPESPFKADALEKQTFFTDHKKYPDKYGHDVSSETNFFYDEAPRETYGERFDRYLKYLDKHRPNGIVEVVLCNYKNQNPMWNQLPKWQPFIEERGFRLVNECFNSNSCNRIYVFHRTTDKE